MASESPGGLGKTQMTWSKSLEFRFGKSGAGAQIYISNRNPGDADVAGPGSQVGGG